MNLSEYKEDYSFKFKLKRLSWYVINQTFFRLLISSVFRKARIGLLRCYGASVPYNAQVYQSCKIWAPWNLKMGNYSCIGPNTQIYNKDIISIGNNSVISQGAFLCTASHDISDPLHSLITAPIIIEDKVWIASDAFIAMGITINEGAVVGARSAVFKNIDKWNVVGGNPAMFIKIRKMKK